jgi:hypothetical protein
MAGGRKGFGEELRIKQRYSALSEPYFNTLKEFLESEDKNDKKFAVTELTKAFSRMIPQPGSSPENPVYFQVPNVIALKNGINPTPIPDINSSGQPSV